MNNTIINVNLPNAAYPIHIGEDNLDTLAAVLRSQAVRGKAGLVTDANVAPLYAGRVTRIVQDAGLECITHIMPAGEANKRLETVEQICGTFLDNGLDRASLLIALGGGVVGDVAGFAASAFMRGVPFLQIPTTIVAQVDSSVGGKTGVNHPLGKNTIGAFHQPCAVIIDMSLLESLPGRELRAGLAEVIKHGVIADPELFAHMENNVEAILRIDLEALRFPVVRSCEIKSEIVVEDEKEQGRRANLNYGHTFGHAIEAATQYTQFLHGEAIALGMCAAGELSRALGMAGATFVERQRDCIAAYGLPTSWRELPVDATLEAMKKDKKVLAGTPKFILANAIGNVVQRTDIKAEQARAALETIRAQ